MKDAINFDEYYDEELIDDPKAKEIFGTPKKRKNAKPPEDQHKDSEGNDFKNYKLKTTGDALSSNANKKLEIYLKKTPQYKVLAKQIELLMDEYKNYKAIGNLELAEKTKYLITELGQKRNKFIKLYKSTNNEKKKEEDHEKVKNSELLTELKEKREALEYEYQMTNPSSLVRKMKNYREILGYVEENLQEYEDESYVDDIDSFLDSDETINPTKQEYDNFCGHIADLIDESPLAVAKMSLNELRKALKEQVTPEQITIEQINQLIKKIGIEINETTKDRKFATEQIKSLIDKIGTSVSNTLLEDFTPKEIKSLKEKIVLDLLEALSKKITAEEITELNDKIDIEIDQVIKGRHTKISVLKDKIDQVKFMASNEMNRLKGNNDITDIIFDVFDFEIVPEEQPKDMLAAANVGYVKAIAYNTCAKLNMLHHMDDAVAYGLMGLTVAINKWYKIQKMQDSAVSFAGFANIYISNNIKKGLYELTSAGRISKSAMASMEHYRKKRMENYVQANPEMKDVPADLLSSILDEVGGPKIEDTVTESTYSDMVGGAEGGDKADIWSNAASTNDDKLMEVKHEYESLLGSIKQLFNLFETKVDKTTGIKSITDRKVFNKYDYKLFKLWSGIEFKRELSGDGKTTVKSEYTQEEIAKIMEDYYRANGVPQTFKQGAISYRINTMLKKMKALMEEYPTMKTGFEYLMNYCRLNREEINYMSNNREELMMKSDREDLKELYADDEQQLNKVLTDGKRLSDVFETSESNPLDDEIADIFMNL